MRFLRALKWAMPVAAMAVIVLFAMACGADKKSEKPIISVSPTPVSIVPTPGTTPQPPTEKGLWAKPPIGKTWQEYFGVELEATFDASGPKIFNPEPGHLYFYTNSGTSWGATNTRNTVEIFDATDMEHWKYVATINLPDEYSLGYSSHGATVSADGRWIYLQAMGHPEKPSRLLIIDGFTLKIHKIYKSMSNARGHHVNNFTGPDGREYIMNVDFNWNRTGAGAWVIDPEKDHAIVGGMNRQDFTGNPYVLSGDVNGKFMYATVPAVSSALRGKMDGLLVKIDMTTWKVVGEVPILDPIWVEVTQDGKIAWVTEGDGQKVKKVDLEKMKVLEEVSTGPGPWGARLSCDETKLYVADKGESAGYGQQGRTMTIIDTRFNIVTNVVLIGRTTDHIILSPDCKYIIANSNADHNLWIYNAETEELVVVVKMPSNGDPHGGTFVQWQNDGKGGVRGEVVSTLTGHRGSARIAQQELIRARKEAINVQLSRYSGNTPAAPTPDTIKVKPGASVSIEFNYPVGTGASSLTVEGKSLGIAQFELQPGGRKLVSFTAPKDLGKYEVTLSGPPKTKPLVIVVEEQVVTPASATPATPQVREIKITANGFKWDAKTLELKAGEKVHFTIVNLDDEKHNLINASAGLMSPNSPDVSGGKTTSFEWTVPNIPGSYKFFCLYHPAMIIDVTIK